MTEAEFITTVAENLGVKAAGQSLPNEDAAIIRARMGPVFATAAGRELTTVANTNNIPDAQALPLADIVAFECATPFSITGQKLMELAAKGDWETGSAIATLRMLTSERPHKSTATFQRFWGPSSAGFYNGTG